MEDIRTLLVGYGYWGPKLARNITAHPEMKLVGIVERDEIRSVVARSDYPDMLLWKRLDQPIGNGVQADLPVDAVVVATPPETHEDISKYALRLGKHVLCEKPMTLDDKSAERLLVAAAASGKVFMVDHVFCHSAPAIKIKQIIDSGELGKLLYIDSTRINLGLFQRHCNVVWDLAVHDLSLIDFFFPELQPLAITAQGTRHYTEQYDTAHVNITYSNSAAIAHVHVNWLSPVKVRQMIIAGEDKSIIWNDMDPVEPIRVYDSGAKVVHPGSLIQRQWQMEYRRGDALVPAVPKTETLTNVLDEFVGAIRDNRKPLTDGCAGRRVVQLLGRASLSLASAGKCSMAGGCACGS
jgi:predicted dehydrogenase